MIFEGPKFSRIFSSNRPCGLVTLLLSLAVLPLQAQELERRDTVADRDRPELDAQGVRAGSFLVYPSAGLELRYEDNIFADDDTEESDAVGLLTPEILVGSNWSRHQLRTGAEAEIARYADFDSEDYEDFSVWGDGRLDLALGRATMAVRHSDRHEDRTSPEDVRGLELTTFSVDSLRADYGYRPGRLLFRADFGYAAFDYDDTVTTSGSVSNADRDRDKIEGGVRAGYEMSPDYTIFTQARLDRIEYDLQFDDDGFERSSDGFEWVVGSSVDFSGRTFGEVYVGYLERDYDDPRFGAADGATFGADVTWNVTGLTTLTLSASQAVDSTTIVGASGIDTTSLGLQVDHELLRNLVLTLDANTKTEDFDGIDREDDVTQAGLAGKYMLNRHFQLHFGYRYRNRDISPSDAGGREYSINDVFLRLVAQL